MWLFTAHVQGLRAPEIVAREVPVNGLPADLDGITVSVMADLHAGEMMVGSRWLNARVDQVQALKPDLIVLLGDLFEREGDPAEMVPVMQKLSAPLGVWAVRGNHDSLRAGRPDVTGDILRKQVFGC
ncbi:MAG: metallophosphoesterase [Desulfobulbaceae bacterium]|nr:metallophosphoesterase [Desulfobulbaceae bacterium]